MRTLGFLVNAYSAAYEFPRPDVAAIPTIYHEAVDYSSKQTESYAAIDAEETCMYIADADADADEQTRTTLQEHHHRRIFEYCLFRHSRGNQIRIVRIIRKAS